MSLLLESIRATCRPAPAPLEKGQRACPHCGIVRKSRLDRHPYCRDCKDEAKALGWLKDKDAA